MTAVVIVNWNSGKLLRSCVESVFANNPNAEIAIVDNASSDGSLETIDEFRDRLHIVRNSANRGFAAGVNQGFASTTSPYVLVLNPDVRVTPGATTHLDGILDAHAKAGAVGGYVNDKYLPREFPTPGSLVRENLGLRANIRRVQTAGPVDQPAAAAILIRRDAYEEIGGFDERFFPAWYEDVDFCQRMKAAGWEIYFEPEGRFEHEGGYSAVVLGAKAFAEAYYRNQFRYAQKHFGAASRLGIRISIAIGMLLRMIARPGQASAYWNVLQGALAGW